MFTPHCLLSGRYWRRHAVRALLVLTSIALGVAACAATQTLQRTLDRASRQAATPLAGAADLYVSNGDAGIRCDLAETLRAIPGVRAVRPLVVQRVVLPELGHRTVVLLGLDLDTAPTDEPGWDLHIERQDALSFRDLFLGRKPALLGAELDRCLPPDVHELTVLAVGRAHRLARAGAVTAGGAAATLTGNALVLRTADAAALFGWTDRVSRLDVSLTPGSDRELLRRRVEEELHGRASVWTPADHDGRVQDMLTGVQVGFALCGLGALGVGIFLVYNTLAVGVAERRHDIGILRSLGATRGQVALLFLGEALGLGLLGSLLGVPLGLGLARLSLGPVQRVLGDVFVALPGQQLDVALVPLLGALAAGVAAALLAGVLPALQAACDNPVEALRRLPPRPGRLKPWLHAIGSLALVGVGVTAAACQDHLPSRLGTCGGLVLLLLAVLLATPLLTALLARLLRLFAQGFLGVGGRLAVENLLRAPGRTGLVIVALTAGVTLLLQTAGLIHSNEVTLRDWIDNSVAGDLWVTSGGPLSASGRTLPVGDDLVRWVRETVPGARVVPMRFRHLDWHWDGRPARVMLNVMDATAYVEANRDRSPALPRLALYQKLAAQPGTAVVSDNFAALQHVRVGDTIALPGLDGPVPLRVLGTVADYSCNRGTVLVDKALYRREFDACLSDVLDVYLPPGADVEAARGRLLRSSVAAERGLCVLVRSELREHILGMVQRLYGLAYGQEIVVGLVALLGMVSALLISVLQRRRELGLLRAVGATRGQVLGSVLVEAVLMGGIGTLLGVLAGWPLEWYTVRVLLFTEAGFVCPVYFPWLTAGAIAALTLLSAVAAGLGPALAASRPGIAAAIVHE